MHICSKEEYMAFLTYDPIEGTLTRTDGTSAVEYRKHNRAVVSVEFPAGVVPGDTSIMIEEHPAAIIAWVMSGNKWSYDQMIVSLNRDLGDITLSNLQSIPKQDYEASKTYGRLPSQITESLALCTLGRSGTIDPVSCLGLISELLNKIPARRR